MIRGESAFSSDLMTVLRLVCDSSCSDLYTCELFVQLMQLFRVLIVHCQFCAGTKSKACLSKCLNFPVCGSQPRANITETGGELCICWGLFAAVNKSTFSAIMAAVVDVLL